MHTLKPLKSTRACLAKAKLLVVHVLVDDDSWSDGKPAETLHRGSVTERVGLGGCCTDFAIDVVTSRDSDLSAGAPRYDPHERVLYGREGHDLGHDDE